MGREHREKFQLEMQEMREGSEEELLAASVVLIDKISFLLEEHQPTIPEVLTALSTMLSSVFQEIAGEELGRNMSEAYEIVLHKAMDVNQPKIQ